MPETFTGGNYGEYKGKSRRKTQGSGAPRGVVTGNRVKGGVTRERRWGRGNPFAAVDQFGLLRESKYRALGPRCRENVARAIASGFVYQGQAATTEEQVCFGELLRRGFELGLGTGPRSFLPQSPIAGSIVDFEVWVGGEKIALRPMNLYWHGQQAKRNHDDLKGELLEAAGYTVYDIWSDDSLSDLGIERRFDEFFGRP